jgi:hypothetical protein
MGFTYYQQMILWDPGGRQYFLGGGTSLPCWSVPELRQTILNFVKKNQQIVKQMIYCLTVIYRSQLVPISQAWSNVDQTGSSSDKHVLICTTVMPNFQNSVP